MTDFFTSLREDMRERYPNRPLAFSTLMTRQMYNNWANTPWDEVKEWLEKFFADLEKSNEEDIERGE
jgi:hypothetical protein